jgi:hypothetical protein
VGGDVLRRTSTDRQFEATTTVGSAGRDPHTSAHQATATRAVHLHVETVRLPGASR